MTESTVSPRHREPIECSSEMGVTIGLIDSIITTARVLGQRLDYDALICGEDGDEHQPIREALTDLATCAELRRLIGKHDAGAMKVIHDAAALLKVPSAHMQSEEP